MSDVRFDRDSVRRLLRLARLETDGEPVVPDDEVDRLAADLARIEESVRQLAAVNVDGVEPTVVSPLARSRDDEIASGLSPDEAVESAAESDGHLFLVPRVVD